MNLIYPFTECNQKMVCKADLNVYSTGPVLL